MPTESAFLLAGLLFVAAALGYVFARFRDDDDGEQGPTQYLRGFRYLLEEQPDRAVEAFTRSGDLDEETLETHFALGQLFRRRGEVERAIRVHRDLMGRRNLSSEQRDQAKFALAGDYLSAGLFDRAEALLTELRGAPRHRVDALRQLIRLSELTREWDRAIDLYAELEKADRSAARPGAIAHYCCELAEQAVRDTDLPRAARMLQKAEQVVPETARVWLARGALAEASGDAETAVRCYRRVVDKEPALLVDVLPRLWKACNAAGLPARFAELVREFLQQDPRAGRAVALASILEPSLDDPVALQCLWNFLQEDRTLTILIDVDRLRQAQDTERQQALERVRGALRALAMTGRSYLCLECGYRSMTLQWQCPSCRAWDTVRPQVRLTFDIGDRR
jgi:lipopolysaccharide biosynthesis regulator YciM